MRDSEPARASRGPLATAHTCNAVNELGPDPLRLVGVPLRWRTQPIFFQLPQLFDVKIAPLLFGTLTMVYPFGVISWAR